jgi:tetratricopeptide (TPR) repeat protein
MTPSDYDRMRLAFHEIVQLDPARREGRLTELHADDPESAAELRSLLLEHDRTGPFLEPAAISFAQTVPEHLANYRIERELGAGGSGRVFLAARMDDEFHRPVALKLLYTYAPDRDFESRLRLERRALAQLNHPNIAHLLDWGRGAENRPFLVTEYVDGLPVDEYCREQQCDLPRRLELFLQICDAVEHAHHHLIVHRDLKPANILVKQDGTVKLLDFGIAKLLRGDESITVTAAQRMTPAYASPEQVRGEAITTSSDIYSLGVVLYELLTGALPYRLSTRTVEEVSRAVIEQEAPRPKLPRDLADILLKALRKEPERRYPSVEQMSADIRRYLEGRPVLASAGSRTYVLGRFVRRNRALVALGTLAFCSLMAGAVLTTWKWRAAEQNLRIAETRYEALRGFAHSVLSILNQGTVTSQTETRSFIARTTVDYLDQLGRERVANDLLQMDIATAYRTLADAEGSGSSPHRGNAAGAVVYNQKAHSILLEQWRLHPDAAHGRALAGSFDASATLMADPKQAAEFFTSGLPVIATLTAKYPTNADVLIRCSDFLQSYAKKLRQSGDLSGAVDSFAAGLALARRALTQKPSDPMALKTVANQAGLLCRTHTMEGNLTLALKEGLEAKDLGDKLLVIMRTRRFRRETAFNLLFLGRTLKEMGDLDGAISNLRPALEEMRAVAAEDPADGQGKLDLATAYVDVGEFFVVQKKPAEALSNFREALSLSKEQSAKDTENYALQRFYATALVRVGRMLVAADPAEASALLDEAIAVCDQSRLLAPSDIYTLAYLAKAYQGKAELAIRQGDQPKASRALLKSVELWREVRQRSPLDTGLKAGAAEAEQELARLHR